MIPIEKINENLVASYKAFKSVIIDNNSSQQHGEVGWKNYQTGIHKTVYSKQYEDLIRLRQFSFLLRDKSALQVYYQYDKEGLKKIRLAYYPYPQTINIKDEQIEVYLDEALSDALETHYMLLHDLMGQSLSVSNTTHVRFDYDRDVTSHSTNHLQIDGIQELRIPFNYIITPFHFLDFIIQSIFVDEYLKIKTTDSFTHLASASNKLHKKVELDKEYRSVYLSI